MGNIHSKILVGLILENMKECVENDNFIILGRDINKNFISEYKLTEAMQREILLKLEIEDYSESEPSSKFPGSYVNLFGKNIELINSHGSIEAISMYIKFEIIEKQYGTRTVFISFHKEDYPLSFPFRI